MKKILINYLTLPNHQHELFKRTVALLNENKSDALDLFYKVVQDNFYRIKEKEYVAESINSEILFQPDAPYGKLMVGIEAAKELDRSAKYSKYLLILREFMSDVLARKGDKKGKEAEQYKKFLQVESRAFVSLLLAEGAKDQKISAETLDFIKFFMGCGVYTPALMLCEYWRKNKEVMNEIRELDTEGKLMECLFDIVSTYRDKVNMSRTNTESPPSTFFSNVAEPAVAQTTSSTSPTCTYSNS